MSNLIDALLTRSWFVDGIGFIVLAVPIVLLIGQVCRILGIHFQEFVEFFASEFHDLMNRKWTVGSVNFACVLFLTVFGVLIYIGIELKSIMHFLAQILGQTKADLFEKSTSLPVLFYVLATVIMVSILCVIADSKK